MVPVTVWRCELRLPADLLLDHVGSLPLSNWSLINGEIPL